jgi:hypothetical protein
MVRLLITAACLLPSLSAAVLNVDIARTIDFQQTTGTSADYVRVFFTGRVFTQNPGDLISATITGPSSGPDNMNFSPNGNVWTFAPAPFSANGDLLLDLADMDAAFQTGTYTFDLDDNISPFQTIAQYNQDLYPLNYQIPLMDETPFDALALGIAPNAAFTFSWAAFNVNANANANFIFFSVRDAANNTVFNSGPLGSSITEIVVPAGTFMELTAYTWDIFFSGREFANDPNTNIEWIAQFNTHAFNGFTTGVNDVPEPATFAVGGVALFALFYTRKRSA